jgi:LuxR family transcriptional regulator, maltose regulon positive regulatory protein
MGLLAKTTRPSSSRIAPRKRLFRLLDRSSRYPNVWIAGPAGCGKTSLVSSYVEARRSPALWYQLDAGDGDAATFFYYMGAALRQAAPRQRRPMPLLTPEYLHDVPTFAQRYFEGLIDRLGTAPVVVLDNYQDVPREAALHAILRRGFAAIPEGARVIVVSRHMPPPAFARFRTHGQMRVIGWEDLRLTIEEARALARAGGERTARNADIQTAYAAADGWAAGLIMMLSSAEVVGTGRRAIGRLTRDEIFDYFGSELFDQTESETQRFLVETALFPSMTARMAQSLTGLGHAGEILARLSDNHFFTTRDVQREPVFQYHPLFRDFLLARGRRIRTHAETAPLLERAATILEGQGHVEDALALAQESASWERLAGLIVKQAPATMAQGRHRTIEAWIRALPSEVVDANAWLLFWQGVSLMPTNLVESRCHLERAFERFDAQSEATGRLLAWSAIVDCHLYAWDDFGRLDPWIAWMDDNGSLLEGTPPDVEAAVVTSMTGALVHRQPQHPRIHEWLHRSRALISGTGNAHFRLRSGSYAFLHYFWAGDVARMRAVLDEILRAARDPDAPPLSRITGKCCEAAASATWRLGGSTEMSLQSVEDGLALARATGVHTTDFMLLAQGAVSAISDGTSRAAREWLDKMAGLALGRDARSYCHFLASWNAVLHGEVERAIGYVDLALPLAIDSGMPYSEAVARLLRAELLHDTGRDVEAQNEIARARCLADGMRNEFVGCMVDLAEARIALDTHTPVADASLARALTTMRERSIPNTYFWVPRWMARVCVAALDGGIEVPFVRQLVRERRLVPDEPPLHCALWPWDLRIASLGTFVVERDDKPLEFSAKAPRRTLLFLKTLIACGERGASGERIADLLWPNAEGDSAQQALTTSLHRLRQLLGNEKAVQLREGWIRLDSRYCWVDAPAFETLLAGADEREGVPSGRLSAEQRRDMERALALYKGPFLGEASEPWLASYRERLRRRFVRGIERVGDSYEQEQRYESAEHWYSKGLDAEEATEHLYQRLIRCQGLAGRTADAVATYERCRRALRSSLGAEPSQETDALLSSLVQGSRGASRSATSVH